MHCLMNKRCNLRQKCRINNGLMDNSSRSGLVENESLPTSTPDIVPQSFSWPVGSSLSRQISHNEYEELMQGSVPCPSCYGSGRIPKEREGELVALIPFNDSRLQPRRTWVWVLLGVIMCLSLCAAILYFLLPRSVAIASSKGPIETVNIVNYTKEDSLKLQFWNAFNVTNRNFYAVRVVNMTSQVINQFQPFLSDVIGGGNSYTSATIPLRAIDHTLFMNITVTLRGNSLRYCEFYVPKFPSYVLMQFDFTVTFEYLGHREQDTLSVRQQVCCAPSGNCTSPNP